jgi:hypothetical protein
LEDEVARLCKVEAMAMGGFCRQCGASFPHRKGEGRCPDCQWVADSAEATEQSKKPPDLDMTVNHDDH